MCEKHFRESVSELRRSQNWFNYDYSSFFGINKQVPESKSFINLQKHIFTQSLLGE